MNLKSVKSTVSKKVLIVITVKNGLHLVKSIKSVGQKSQQSMIKNTVIRHDTLTIVVIKILNLYLVVKIYVLLVFIIIHKYNMNVVLVLVRKNLTMVDSVINGIVKNKPYMP